jgi:hypothetical protein
VLRMRTMSFRMQQYGSYQVTIEAKHRRSTCPGRLRGPGHPTTTLHRCSDNRVEAHMQQSDALDTKRCAEPAWFRKKHEQLYTKLMRISHLLEQISRQARAFPVIGDNEDAR